MHDLTIGIISHRPRHDSTLDSIQEMCPRSRSMFHRRTMDMSHDHDGLKLFYCLDKLIDYQTYEGIPIE